jgi:hypothetical protein
MNKIALTNLAQLLEEEADNKDFGFHLGYYISKPYDDGGYYVEDYKGSECETTACIAGWACSYIEADTGAILKERRTFVPEHSGYASFAALLLNIDRNIANDLFEPMNTIDENDTLVWRYRNWDEVTPHEAAQVVRHLAETGTVDWDVYL